MKYLILLSAVIVALLAVPLARAQTNWPHAIPCRIHDGPNPDLLVMTLGDVQTPLAQGTFDAAADTVACFDGTVISNYYRDVLGVTYYHPLDKSRFPLPPSGWCTWYYYYNRINAGEVSRNADWIAANLKDYGAQVVQIDDGWQGSGAKGSARNWELVNINHFPAGLQPVAAHIKSLGLTPGLWLAPHGQNNDQVVRDHPGVFLLKPDGSTASDTWEGRFLVDPSNPASQTYLHDLFQQLVGWGYDYFKIDGQPIVVDEYHRTGQFMKFPSNDAAGLYRQTISSIRSAIGPDRYLLGCWGIPLEGAGIMNGSRTGGDVVLGWDGFQVALRPTLQYYYLQNIVWYCDPDVLLVRPPLTLDQARAWATLEGLTGQALMSSDRLMDLVKDRVELLRRVFPATNIRPLDLFPAAGYKHIWDLKVSQLGRHYDVVGLFNFSPEQTRPLNLNWPDLGLPTGTPIHVFDFWRQEYLGAWRAGLQVPVSPASCQVLTLLPDNGKIQLISTSRHITQGPVELTALEANGNIFQGRSRLIKNDPYALSFVFPCGTNMAMVRASAKSGWRHLPLKISNHQGWASVEIISPRTQSVDWKVEFQPTNAYDFPPSAPEYLSARLTGLSDVTLTWPEQYYLNSGYQVYLDGQLLGHALAASYQLSGLDARSNHVAVVKTVTADGRESARSARCEFTLADLVPASLPLTESEATHTSGQWDGYEADSMLDAASHSVAGVRHDQATSAFAGASLDFDLQGLYKNFVAQVGVDDHSAPEAQVIFRVLADGREVWHSDPLHRKDLPVPVKLDVTGVRRLTLQSSKSGDFSGRAQIDWLEPRLLR